MARDGMIFSWTKYQSTSGIVNVCVGNGRCTSLSPKLVLPESKCWRTSLGTGVSESGMGTERGLGPQFHFLQQRPTKIPRTAL